MKAAGAFNNDSITKTELIVVNSVSSGGVDFSATPTQGDNPLLVRFTDLSTLPGADFWSWDFGWVYAADLDGDQDVDVISASSADDKIAWYENLMGMDLHLVIGDGPGEAQFPRGERLIMTLLDELMDARPVVGRGPASFPPPGQPGSQAPAPQPSPPR